MSSTECQNKLLTLGRQANVKILLALTYCIFLLNFVSDVPNVSLVQRIKTIGASIARLAELSPCMFHQGGGLARDVNSGILWQRTRFPCVVWEAEINLLGLIDVSSVVRSRFG